MAKHTPIKSLDGTKAKAYAVPINEDFRSRLTDELFKSHSPDTPLSAVFLGSIDEENVRVGQAVWAIPKFTADNASFRRVEMCETGAVLVSCESNDDEPQALDRFTISGVVTGLQFAAIAGMGVINV